MSVNPKCHCCGRFQGTRLWKGRMLCRICYDDVQFLTKPKIVKYNGNRKNHGAHITFPIKYVGYRVKLDILDKLDIEEEKEVMKNE